MTDEDTNQQAPEPNSGGTPRFPDAGTHKVVPQPSEGEMKEVIHRLLDERHRFRALPDARDGLNARATAASCTRCTTCRSTTTRRIRRAPGWWVNAYVAGTPGLDRARADPIEEVQLARRFTRRPADPRSLSFMRCRKGSC
jgi:hypothetical protein